MTPITTRTRPPDAKHPRNRPPCGRSTYLRMAKSRHAHALGGPRLPRPDPPDDRPGPARSASTSPGSRSTPASTRRRTASTWATSSQLCTLRRFQEAGHRPISLAGGGTGMIGDPGGKQDERQLLDLARPSRGTSRGSVPSSASSSIWTAPCCSTTPTGSSTLSTLEYLRDVGKHFTVNQMVAKESVKTRFERPDQGISYTEFSYMLLQAYDFLRLHLDHGCDLQFGGSDQWGNITMGVDFIRKVCGDEVWGFTTPLIVKPDGTKYGKTEIGHGLARRRADQPLRHVPVLRQHARRAGGRAAAVPHLPRATTTSPISTPTRRSSPQRREAQRALARAVVGARPRRGRGGQVRGGVGRALRRGDRRPQRGDAAGRDRGRPDDRRYRGPSSLGGLDPRRRPRADRPGQVEEGGAPHHRAGRRLRQQRAADRRRAHLRPPTISCTTATSCCARAGERSTSSGPHEASGSSAASLVLVTGCALTLTSCAGADQEGSPAHRMSVWVSGTSFGEDIGTLVADNARVPKDVPNGDRRRARRLQHHAQRRRDGQHRPALARPRR